MTPQVAALLAADTSPFVKVLLALAVVLAVGRVVGIVFVRLGQPVVIGEIVAGIALGPSLLGLVPGRLDERLFPDDVLPYLSTVAKLGIVLFMFVIGLELDMSVVRRSGRRAAAISLTSIMVPFLLGALVVGPMLFDRYPSAPKADGTAIAMTPFVLFVGVSMCGSAFAILARILAERDMFKLPLGATLVACAAIDDVVVFTLLAVTIAVAGGSGVGGVLVTLGQLALIVIALIVVVRPLIERLVLRPYRQTHRLAAEHMAIVFLFLMLSSWATAWIGVSELIGAFLFGAVIPRESTMPGEAPRLFPAIAGRVEGVSVQLLLPVFFVVAGQGVVLGGLGVDDIAPAVGIVAIAWLGKFVGGAGAARLTGLPRRQSLAVGTLLNTRGLAELVVLGLARDSGAISTEVYTMLVIMAVVTTISSGPLLRVMYPDQVVRRDIATAERAATGVATDRALVFLRHAEDGHALIDLAVAFGGARPTSSVTLVQFVPMEEGFGAVAEALAPLQALRKHCEEAGVSCVVVCRPSARPDDDVVVEVRRVAPDAVLMSTAAPQLVAAVNAEGADVVQVRGAVDVSAGVTAPGGPGRHDRAALELAVRLALHDRVPLRVDSMPRHVHRQLRQLGVTLGDGLLAVTTGDDGGALQVSAGDRDRVSIYERLGPWRVGDVVNPLSSR